MLYVKNADERLEDYFIVSLKRLDWIPKPSSMIKKWTIKVYWIFFYEDTNYLKLSHEQS